MYLPRIGVRHTFNNFFNYSSNNTEPSSNEKKTNFTATVVKKEKILNKINEEAYQVNSSDSDNNDDDGNIINPNQSSEFLKSLFNRGVYHD